MRAINFSILILFFCTILFCVVVPAFGDDQAEGTVMSVGLQLEGVNLLLERLEGLLQYQVGLLSILSGILLAFVFLYGLHLR